MPGFIESVNVNISNDTSWETTEDPNYAGLDSSIAQLPHYLDVSISFKPISDTLPNRYGTHILNNKLYVETAEIAPSEMEITTNQDAINNFRIPQIRV